MLAETLVFSFNLLQNCIQLNVRDFKASASKKEKTRLKPEVRTPCLASWGDHCKNTVKPF